MKYSNQTATCQDAPAFNLTPNATPPGSNVPDDVETPPNPLFLFFNKCENHDWFYAYSDDRRKYVAGQRAGAALVTESKTSDTHAEIYNAWHRHVFSGDLFGKPAMPRPVWEDFE